LKKTIFLIIILGMFGWAVYDFIADSSNQQDMEFTTTEDTDLIVEDEQSELGLNVGERAPNFELTTLAGETIQLSDYRGQRVMLNFWATWCPPCEAEMPDMEKFYQEDDVEIIAVNLTQTEASLSDVKAFVEDLGLNFTIALDQEDPTVAIKYAIRPIPTTYMIDSAGIIQQKTYGALNYEQMHHALNQMD